MAIIAIMGSMRFSECVFSNNVPAAMLAATATNGKEKDKKLHFFVPSHVILHASFFPWFVGSYSIGLGY